VDLGLKSKRALVTGSTAGIGFAAGARMAQAASATTGAAVRVDGGAVQAIV
jgi:NAD(P)-dependent dehydrogenase (short-subunit alcohol dehydrogenase family)